MREERDGGSVEMCKLIKTSEKKYYKWIEWKDLHSLLTRASAFKDDLDG